MRFKKKTGDIRNKACQKKRNQIGGFSETCVLGNQVSEKLMNTDKKFFRNW
jgi:hypothetical protein